MRAASDLRLGPELGCPIGVLTERLAGRCRTLVALDVADRALSQARVRCRHLARVRLERRQIPQQFPDGRFDLILMSEIGYYLSQSDLTRTIRLIRQALKRPEQAFLVHWTPEAGDVRSPAIRSTSSR